jgi:hypothetical protein
MSTDTNTRPTTDVDTGRRTLFRVLIAITTLVVLLQGVWAGVFLEHDGKRDDASSWIDVHARGADLAILLALAAAVAAFVQVRRRKDLWAGSAVLTVLLVLESYLGGLIRDESKDTLTAVHVPLAMAIVGLCTALVVRGRRAD